MTFQLRPRESVDHGLRRLARKALRSAAQTLTDSKSNTAEATHEIRRSLKKARAVLKLVKMAGGRGLKKDERRLRRIARSLSDFRDADVRVGTFERLRRLNPSLLSKPSLRIVHDHLRGARDELSKDVRSRERRSKLARLLGKSRRSTVDWHPAHRRFQPLASALKELRRNGRKAMTCARKSDEASDFHRWRKILKTHWYGLRLLGDCDAQIRREIQILHQVQAWLGEDHDIAVLSGYLFSNSTLVDVCRDLSQVRHAAGRHQSSLRRQALAHAVKIYAGTNRSYVDRLEKSWRAWRHRS